MIGLFPGDGPESPYEHLIEQRVALRLRIADCGTTRARLEYQRSRREQRGQSTDLAEQAQGFTTQVGTLNRMEHILRELEAQLTLRIRARDP